MRYYHLQPVSGSRLPRPPHSLILKPQVPKNPHQDINGDIIEDDFTPRISLGETLEDCLKGLTTDGYHHVYQTIDDLDLEQPTSAGPSTPRMDYDSDFVLEKWVAYQAKKQPDVDFTNAHQPSGLPSPFKEEFEFCVPDVGETNEYWSLDPVRVKYMGVVYGNDDDYLIGPDETSRNPVPMLAAAAALRKLIATDYRGEHKAPGKDDAPLHDLTFNERYPKDVYDNLSDYRDGEDWDYESMAKIRQLKGKPEGQVRIYRALPKDVYKTHTKADNKWLRDVIKWDDKNPDATDRSTRPKRPQIINPGDWVTLSESYAKAHAKGNLGGNGAVVQKSVRAKELHTDGNSINEWGYNP